MDIKQVESLERRLATMTEARSKAEGAKEQLLGQLKSEFGLDNVEAAEELELGLCTRLENLGKQADTLLWEVSGALTAAGY